MSRYKAVFILSLLIMCPLLVFGNNDEDDSDFDPEEDDFDGYGSSSWGTGYDGDYQRNEHQQSTYDSVLSYCLAFAILMYKNNELFIPLASTWSYFIANNLPKLGDSCRSKVYLYGTSISNCFKVGHAYSGRVRDAFYDKIGKHVAFTVFNLDIQHLENHNSLVKAVLDFCRQFCAITPAQLFGLTLHDAFEYEHFKLPFALGLFLYALGHSKEECPKMGGGIAIMGYLRRLILFFVESGVQMLCATLGMTLSDSSQAHEWLCGSLDWVAKAHFRCCNMVDKFWKAMQTIDTSGNDPRVWKLCSAYFGYYSSYLDTITAQSIPVFAMSTWKPGIPDGTIIFLTPLLMNLIFSYLGGWVDAFGDVTPPANDPYNPNRFRNRQRGTARETIYKWLDMLQLNIMFGALDVNDAAFEGSNNSAKAELHRRGWKVLIDFNQFGYDIIVYFFQLEVGYWPSIIFLYRPPCFMANTDMQTALDEWLAKVKHYQTRAEEMYIIFLICRLLQKPSTSFEAERRFRFIPVFGNILVAHSVFVSLVQNLHIGRKFAVLFFKQLLTDYDCNAFDEGNTRLLISGGNHEVVASALRRRIQRTGSVNATYDCHRFISVLNALGRNLVPRAATIIREGYRGSMSHFTERNFLSSVGNAALSAAFDQTNGSHSQHRNELLAQGVVLPDGLYWDSTAGSTANPGRYFIRISLKGSGREKFGKKWGRDELEGAKARLAFIRDYMSQNGITKWTTSNVKNIKDAVNREGI